VHEQHRNVDLLSVLERRVAFQLLADPISLRPSVLPVAIRSWRWISGSAMPPMLTAQRYVSVLRAALNNAS